ncbi:hypothetical protein B0T26DRAFT_710430 [Lasiosphaeria miniovina]|uniref:Uncharacterized protein n=1 Tax=Lasiosphaeria miniovina TaxID=1954250 RepID=A0AA40AKW3_9PEZI|nr:uncharacterized protein B0T26DRAFT_710430 [Lasiosphaeria miniovina]KAK0717645.1 hypothetical protein B0T26DRAFT_710430 [Lasiosphaeria miniovina]
MRAVNQGRLEAALATVTTVTTYIQVRRGCERALTANTQFETPRMRPQSIARLNVKVLPVTVPMAVPRGVPAARGPVKIHAGLQDPSCPSGMDPARRLTPFAP